MPFFSIIVPVYNRPEELRQLLGSIKRNTFRDIEVIVIDDGSDQKSDEVCKDFEGDFPLRYHWFENAGPGIARNQGAGFAQGEWLLFFDSDCELPENHLSVTHREIMQNPDMDFFGGPDRDREDFARIQRGINYAMTAFLTTGGIRGGDKVADTYYPRSFNFGIRRECFLEANGFSDMRTGEDLDLSMRLMKLEKKSRLLPNSWVYHKRRTGFGAFFRQVHSFGKARIELNKRHPGTLKAVHTVPALFTMYLAASLLLLPFTPQALLPVIVALLVWAIDASIKTGSILTGATASLCALIQMAGYGSGFLLAFVSPQRLEGGNVEPA